MSLSISNSDYNVRKISIRWLKIFSSVFILLFICILLFNYLYAAAPKLVEAEQEAQLTAYKIFSKKRYNVVASGSSRINFGIDPVTMQPYFPDLSIYNCAMFGGSINKEILDYLENRKIAWDDPKIKIVILELSPRVMWKQLRKNKNYRLTVNKSPDEIARLMRYSPDKRFSLHNLLMPMSRDRWNLRKNKKIKSIPYCHPDTGWYEVVNIASDRERDIQKRLANAKKANVSISEYDIAESLNEILKKINEWTMRGVFVFGVIPPIDPRIQVLEEKLSNYDSEKIKTLFQNAGGVVLNTSSDYNVTLGGSHLDSDEAKRFSKEIAIQIRKHILSDLNRTKQQPKEDK